MPSAMTRRWLMVAAGLTLLYAGYTARRVAQFENERRSAAPADSASTAGEAEHAETKAKASSEPIAPFTLTDQAGQPFDTAQLRGKVWVASFFFVSCPSVCVRLNQAISNLQLAEPTSDVHFVSITCDPENDTPEVLDRYARHFKADPRRWTFLTGDLTEIQKIGRGRFQVALEKETHSDRTFAIDREGRIRGRYRVNEPEQLEKLKLLLAKLEAEPAPSSGSEAAPSATAAPGAAESAPADKPTDVANPATDSPPTAAPREGAGS